MSRSRIALLCSIAVLACQDSPPSDAEGVRRAIETHNANLQRWYLAGHVDSVVAVFAEDVWQLPPNMPAIVGRDSLRAFWTQATGWGRWEFTFTTQDVAAAGAMAVERGYYTLRFTPGPDAPMPALEDRGNYVVLWRRQPDGQWRIVWDAPVSEVPVAGPPQ